MGCVDQVHQPQWLHGTGCRRMPLRYCSSAPVALRSPRLALHSLCCRDCQGGMTSQPYARVTSMLWTDRRISTALDRVSLTAWKSSLACYILTFLGNSYPRKGG